MKSTELKGLPGCADRENLSTWARYKSGLCDSCRATCCTMPVEVKIDDLIRMGILSDFDRQEQPKKLARQLKKEGIIEHFNFKNEVFTLSRMANDDCLYLDTVSRRCTIYALRPDTCRNHPQIGPRPGYCPYQPR
jgi:Fe-S-cluster containining protein